MTQDTAVEVRVRITARPVTVWSYLADPERFRAWMGEASEIEPRVGGRLVVRYANGDVARGRLLELEPPRLAVFSWGFEGGRHGLEPEASRVTIELRPHGDGTELVLRHAGLPDEALRRGQRAGWRHYTARLAGLATDHELQGAEQVLERYFAAWNEDDPRRRRVLIDACFSEDVFFADVWAIAQGRDELAEHIAQARALSPAAKLQQVGPSERVREYVSFAWRAGTPDGAELAAGTNFGVLDAFGLIRRLIGFWR